MFARQSSFLDRSNRRIVGCVTFNCRAERGQHLSTAIILPAKLAPSVPFVYSMVWCLSGSFIESFLFINLSFATSRFISNLYPYGLL